MIQVPAWTASASASVSSSSVLSHQSSQQIQMDYENSKTAELAAIQRVQIDSHKSQIPLWLQQSGIVAFLADLNKSQISYMIDDADDDKWILLFHFNLIFIFLHRWASFITHHQSDALVLKQDLAENQTEFLTGLNHLHCCQNF